ncbi:pantoate--beta-alanine ligase domain protein [Oesophagostomum dentatum]|uniref:Pantoate--beta-alanine ligase domain protein n=1 Tax=Oesophagostomum dentatum TaxID=61180 RepID=A0A0B1SZJ8_OESDE|nr:pantoate--beta-alanine ligase domain protein [Oesophagostomum dentatum]
MSLGLVDVQGTTGHVLHPKKAEFCSNDKVVFSGVVNEVSESTNVGHKSERILLHLETDTSVDGFLFPNLVSDSLDSPFEMMKGVFHKGQKLTSLAALGTLSGMNRVSTLVFLYTSILPILHITRDIQSIVRTVEFYQPSNV